MTEEKKRVYCLYRVSTLGQVEKDDIPMQRQTCREFAQMQNWTILKEYAEPFPDLQIIAPDIFAQAQELLTQRSAYYKERNRPLNTKGQTLLSGNVF